MCGVTSMGCHVQREKIVAAVITSSAMAVILCAGCKRATVTAPPAGVATLDPWKQAIGRVEQDRGEAMGRNALVEVPAELRHYADRRRFLAVQAADSHAHNDSIPSDFADLAQLIQQRSFVEMKPLGQDYVLYGVGQNVGGGPFTHYDRATRQDISLAATRDDLGQEMQRAIDLVKDSKARLAYLVAERRRAPARDRALRTALLNEVTQARKLLNSTVAKSRLLGAFYENTERSELLMSEHRLLSNLARDFEGEAYDLNDVDAMKRFKTRLLSFIRPQARDLLIRIAHDYKEKFDRPLPISSLVRPEQYQHELSKRNANAARGSTPPHSTGLAFDVYYGYMSAAEQEYLMSVIARLKDAGQVEALRESRENIHVYVFANGARPAEKLIAQVIAGERLRKPHKRSHAVSAH
ncbi:MAG: DUF5715 family protein [Acidobacteriota bacterium]